MSRQNHHPSLLQYSDDTFRFSCWRLLVILTISYWTNTAAAESLYSCDEEVGHIAQWPLASEVRVACGELPVVLMLQSRLPFYDDEDEVDSLWLVKGPSKYQIFQARPDGSAEFRVRSLPRYNGEYGDEFLLGGDREPQGFSIIGINYPNVAITGRFFDDETPLISEHAPTSSKTLWVDIADQRWMISSHCAARTAPNANEQSNSCWLQAQSDGPPQVLIREHMDTDPLPNSAQLEHSYSGTERYASWWVIFGGDLGNDKKLDLLLRTSSSRGEISCMEWQLLSEQEDGKLALTAYNIHCP